MEVIAAPSQRWQPFPLAMKWAVGVGGALRPIRSAAAGARMFAPLLIEAHLPVLHWRWEAYTVVAPLQIVTLLLQLLASP